MRVAVIGAGVTGLAVTYELLRRGHDVTCYEAATPMGARSTGDTRIFRLAHDRPGLVAWALRAQEAWAAWSHAAGRQLVGGEGTVVSGDIQCIADAMAAAGAPHQVTDTPPADLPADDPPGPFLLDPAGGVIRAAETGRFLQQQCQGNVARDTVTRLTCTDRNTVVLETPSGSEHFDTALITAGAGTPALAAQVGIAAPSTLIHHARFTFPLRRPEAVPPCWLDRSRTEAGAFGSYQHATTPGRWAVGGHLRPDDVRWELGRDAATERSRHAVTDFVRRHVFGAVPEPVEVVYCDVVPRLGDGLSVVQEGPVFAAWGDNLFKLAPVIGHVLAQALIDRELPAEVDDVAHPQDTA